MLCTLWERSLTPTPITCTYFGIIFGFFLLNIFLDCLWKRDELMLKVKILLVNAEELFMVFPDGFEEATPGMATNMYSLLLQWTTGLNAAVPQMKVSHFTCTSVVLSLGSGTIFACLHCIEIRLDCSIILLLSNVHSLTSECGLHTFYSRQGVGCSETDGLVSSLQCASAWVLGHPEAVEEVHIPMKAV